MTVTQQAYLIGALAIVALYVLSRIITGTWAPFAFAHGYNGNLSTSLFQNLLFTVLTVFAYITIIAARFLIAKTPITSLPGIPLNLLVLLGFSVVTATGSKAITVQYIDQEKLKKLDPSQDKSALFKNRDGNYDIQKFQMRNTLVL